MFLFALVEVMLLVVVRLVLCCVTRLGRLIGDTWFLGRVLSEVLQVFTSVEHSRIDDEDDFGNLSGYDVMNSTFRMDRSDQEHGAAYDLNRTFGYAEAANEMVQFFLNETSENEDSWPSYVYDYSDDSFPRFLTDTFDDDVFFAPGDERNAPNRTFDVVEDADENGEHLLNRTFDLAGDAGENGEPLLNRTFDLAGDAGENGEPLLNRTFDLAEDED